MDNFRLLFIDDDPRSYTLVENMLSGFDHPHYQIEWIAAYTHGLKKLKENQHDVCLLDYRLGHQNGIMLLQDAMKEGCDIPVILLTAYGSHDVDLEVMELGSMDYLDKRQLTPDILERSIRYAHSRKKLERELQELYLEKKHLEQLKTDMIRIASHDIRNPVTAILLNIYMLLNHDKPGLPDLALERVHIIQQNTLQIKNIVESILSLEWIEEIHRRGLSPINLVPVVEQSISETSQNFLDKKQNFDYKITAEKMIVEGEVKQLGEAISNILMNANRYTAEGGHIRLSLEICDDWAEFIVQDDGYGVPEEDHERIFEPFFRSAHTVALGQGTGLGLHLVRNIIQRHNGEMIFQSTPGVGSEFGFRLPLVNLPDYQQG